MAMEDLRAVAAMSLESSSVTRALVEYTRLPQNLVKIVQSHLLATLQGSGLENFDEDFTSKLLQIALRFSTEKLVASTSVLQQHLTLTASWQTLSHAVSKRDGAERQWFIEHEKQYVSLAALIEGCKVSNKEAPEDLQDLAGLVEAAEKTVQKFSLELAEICKNLLKASEAALVAVGLGGPESKPWRESLTSGAKSKWPDIVRAEVEEELLQRPRGLKGSGSVWLMLGTFGVVGGWGV